MVSFLIGCFIHGRLLKSHTPPFEAAEFRWIKRQTTISINWMKEEIEQIYLIKITHMNLLKEEQDETHKCVCHWMWWWKRRKRLKVGYRLWCQERLKANFENVSVENKNGNWCAEIPVLGKAQFCNFWIALRFRNIICITCFWDSLFKILASLQFLITQIHF